MLGSILKIGVPVAVQDGCIQVAFMFITVIANHRGLVDAAAVGLVEKMISFLFIVPSSMGATVSALTAQNAGAGKGDRARQVLKDAMTISAVYGCLITVLMWLVAPALSLFCQGRCSSRRRYRLYAQLYFRRDFCRHPHLL